MAIVGAFFPPARMVDAFGRPVQHSRHQLLDSTVRIGSSCKKNLSSRDVSAQLGNTTRESQKTPEMKPQKLRGIDYRSLHCIVQRGATKTVATDSTGNADTEANHRSLRCMVQRGATTAVATSSTKNGDGAPNVAVGATENNVVRQ